MGSETGRRVLVARFGCTSSQVWPARDMCMEAVLDVLHDMTPRIEALQPGWVAFPASGFSRSVGGEAEAVVTVVRAIDQVLGRSAATHASAAVAGGLLAAVLAAALPVPSGSGSQASGSGSQAAGSGSQAAGSGSQAVGIQPDCCLLALGPLASPAERGILPWQRGTWVTVPGAGMLVSVGMDREFCAPFPIRVLREVEGIAGDEPAGELVEVLEALGVATVGEFSEIPAAAVFERFGAPGSVWHRRCLGRDDHLPVWHERAGKPFVEVVCDPPAEQVEAVGFQARSAVERLLGDLGSNGLAATRIGISFANEAGEVQSRLWEHAPAFSVDLVLQRLRWQLEGWVTRSGQLRGHGSTSGEPVAESPPGGGITYVRVTVEDTAIPGAWATSLWGEAAWPGERVRQALDRLAGLLGTDAVLEGYIREGRTPVERSGFRPFHVPSADPRRSHLSADGQRSDQMGSAPWPGHHLPPAPALVHIPAIPAKLLGGDRQPVVVNGRGHLNPVPAWLVTPAFREPACVEGWAGPWLVDQRWWLEMMHDRQAMLQVLVRSRREEIAYLLSFHRGSWSIHATYD